MLRLPPFRRLDFNPRSPHGERPSRSSVSPRPRRNFNPRSPHGERRGSPPSRRRRRNFNPRSPHGERRHIMSKNKQAVNFNPRSPHGERHRSTCDTCVAIAISIHAPRTGSDAVIAPKQPPRGYFNPRSPHGERPPYMLTSFRFCVNFNPRSPHGERLAADADVRHFAHISIHAPRTGSDMGALDGSRKRSRISIHAPRTGSDANEEMQRVRQKAFQSTLPARGATSGRNGRAGRHG